jgi:hypothetical protein
VIYDGLCGSACAAETDRQRKRKRDQRDEPRRVLPFLPSGIPSCLIPRLSSEGGHHSSSLLVGTPCVELF